MIRLQTNIILSVNKHKPISMAIKVILVVLVVYSFIIVFKQGNKDAKFFDKYQWKLTKKDIN